MVESDPYRDHRPKWLEPVVGVLFREAVMMFVVEFLLANHVLIRRLLFAVEADLVGNLLGRFALGILGNLLDNESLLVDDGAWGPFVVSCCRDLDPWSFRRIVTDFLMPVAPDFPNVMALWPEQEISLCMG